MPSAFGAFNPKEKERLWRANIEGRLAALEGIRTGMRPMPVPSPSVCNLRHPEYQGGLYGISSVMSAAENNAIFTSLLGTGRKITLRGGTFSLSGVTIPAGTTDLTIEGVGPARTNPGATIITGGAGITLFTLGNGLVKIRLRHLTLISDVCILCPPGSIIEDLELEDVVIGSGTLKGIYITDTSSGSHGGIVQLTLRDVEAYGVQCLVHAVKGAMLTNFHVEGGATKNPANGGYMYYIGGCDNNLVNTNISIKDHLINQTVTTTSIPFYIGQVGKIDLDNVHVSDAGLTVGTNDGLPIFELGGSAVSNGRGLSNMSIKNCDFGNARGPVIDVVTTNGIGQLSIENSMVTASRAGGPIIAHANRIDSFLSKINRLSSDTPIDKPALAWYIGDILSGNPLPQMAAAIPQNLIPVFVSSSPYSIAPSQGWSVFLVTTGAGGIELHLPHADSVPAGTELYFKKIDSGAGDAVIYRNGTPPYDSIDSDYYFALPNQNDAVILISDGIDHWWTFGG